MGIAFGQRAASDTFVARQVGVDPVIEAQDLAAWPVPYRLGIFEGFIISRWGFAWIAPQWVPVMVNVLLHVPTHDTIAVLADITQKVAQAEHDNVSREASAMVLAAMEAEGFRLPAEVQPAWTELAHQFMQEDESDL